jgi:hypothetical protein
MLVFLNPEQVVSVSNTPTGHYEVRMSNGEAWALSYNEMLEVGLISHLTTSVSTRSSLSEKIRLQRGKN